MTQDPFANIEIAPREVEALIARGGKFLFVDVREKWEHETARIEGAVLIPLREIPASLPRLAGTSEIVLFCHHGMRSLSVVDWLRRQGVGNCRSMAGGIDAWSLQIDPAVPRY